LLGGLVLDTSDENVELRIGVELVCTEEISVEWKSSALPHSLVALHIFAIFDVEVLNLFGDSRPLGGINLDNAEFEW